MYRIIFLGLFIANSLQAESYAVLLQKALENNSALKITKTQTEQERLKGAIDTRLENPTLELEIADFSAKRVLRENEFGGRVGVSQSLLLPSFKSDKENLVQSKVEVAKERFVLERSTFVYRFNRYYLNYKEMLKKEQLAQETLEVSEQILSVVKERFNAGSIAKSELLQAQIEEREVLSELKHLSLDKIKAKNRLLLFSNLQGAYTLPAEHIFSQQDSDSKSSLITLTQKKEAVAHAQLAVASHGIESIELFSEIEAEPDQDIFRVGIAIPLPVFNKKSEEKQLAKIALNNQKSLLNLQEKALVLEIKQLQEEMLGQEELKNHYQSLVTEQEQLLAMYQEGYAIAKVNLLKLNILKKSLLQSKKQHLEASLALERNSIKINYLQGAYNE